MRKKGSQSFDLRYLYTFFLPFNLLLLMQIHSEMWGFPCPSRLSLLLSGAESSSHTHTQFQATGKDSEGLVQEIYKNVELRKE